MMTKYAALALYLGCCALALAQDAFQSSDLFARRYREGEKLTYHMKGINDGRRYELQATGVVRRDPQGNYFEEYAWSNLVDCNV